MALRSSFLIITGKEVGPRAIKSKPGEIKRSLFIEALINDQIHLIKFYLRVSNLKITPNLLNDNILHLIALYGKPNTIIKIIDFLPVNKVRLFSRSVDNAGSLPINLLYANNNLSPNQITQIKKKLYGLKLYPEFKPLTQLLTPADLKGITDKYSTQITASTKLRTYFTYAFWLQNEVRKCMKYSYTHPRAQDYKLKDFEKIYQVIEKMRANNQAQFGKDKDQNRQIEKQAAIKMQHGNCGEHAIVAQHFLFKAGIPSTICLTRDDHWFLAVGLDPVKHAANFEKWNHPQRGEVLVIKTWPKDVLLVDTWAGNIFLPKDIPEKLSDFRHEIIAGRFNPIIIPHNPMYQKIIIGYSNHHLLKSAALPAKAPTIAASAVKKPVAVVSVAPDALFSPRPKPAGAVYRKAMQAYATFRAP